MLPNCSVPPPIVVTPVKVLPPLRANIPLPTFVSDPLPLSAAIRRIQIIVADAQCNRIAARVGQGEALPARKAAQGKRLRAAVSNVMLPPLATSVLFCKARELESWSVPPGNGRGAQKGVGPGQENGAGPGGRDAISRTTVAEDSRKDDAAGRRAVF